MWSDHPDASRARRYVLREDDPRMGLSAGDVLLCVPYWLDPDKLTVLGREVDGFDPRCNVYRSQVERDLSGSPEGASDG